MDVIMGAEGPGMVDTIGGTEPDGVGASQPSKTCHALRRGHVRSSVSDYCPVKQRKGETDACGELHSDYCIRRRCLDADYIGGRRTRASFFFTIASSRAIIPSTTPHTCIVPDRPESNRIRSYRASSIVV